MSGIRSKTILFVTGAFVSHYCWNDWAAFFESNGYKTVLPSWPAKEGEPAALRASQPNKAIAELRLAQVIDHYANIARNLPEKPIIIGHSLGGLITQVLVNRGLSAGAIAIHSVPPQGILPYELNFLKSNTKALGYFTSIDEAYLRSFPSFQFAFTNGMPLAEQQAAYDALCIPESKRVVRDGLTSAAAVDFSKPHPPLLFLAGTEDHCIPPTLNERTFKKYKKNDTPGSVTEFVLKQRNHFVLGLPTWKEDAGYVLDWIKKH
ncbi:alpha/beta hydrolase [uncultured Chitinophaga sp.]|uniref:alpha/beta hydrolase n=1 Tax=uncultured Chitinophaga sp. TaxID=339340 RepID=UPI0025E5EC93|nr:alpha/beta hydrolase [uncultured Chitinophaga sp.]